MVWPVSMQSLHCSLVRNGLVRIMLLLRGLHYDLIEPCLNQIDDFSHKEDYNEVGLKICMIVIQYMP